MKNNKNIEAAKEYYKAERDSLARLMQEIKTGLRNEGMSTQEIYSKIYRTLQPMAAEYYSTSYENKIFEEINKSS